MIGENLLRYKFKDTKFLVIDTETEGLNLCRSRPWEIGWHIYHGYKKIESHVYYLKWKDLKVSQDAARITGFELQTVLKEGKEPKFVIDLLDSYIYNTDYKIIGANFLGFDIYIHNLSRLMLGYKTDYSFLDRIYDTVALSRAYKLGIKIPENKEHFIPFQYSLLNIKQKGLKSSNSAMAKEFGLAVDDGLLHSTSHDIDLTFGVFQNLIKNLEIQ